MSVRTDQNDNVFVMGYTSSLDFPLVNAGTYFDSVMAPVDMDLFLTKFDNNGAMLWSTYFGAAGNVSTTWDFINYDHLEIDTSGSVYISFNRGVDPLPTLDPGCSAYYNTTGRIALAKFSNAGNFLWGTYLGMASGEVRCPIAVDKFNNLFVGGEFNSYSSTAGLPLLDPGGGAYFSSALGPNITTNHQAFQLKFVPAFCSVVPNFVANDNHICPGACIDFINSTTGATNYQWIFSGANPSTSNAENPQNICYNTPGLYPVTLIASNPVSTDTLTLNAYITVFPSPPPQAILQSGDTLIANAGAVSYQWYFAGNAIPGATEYFYVASQSGDYNVVATDANGCEVEAAIFNVVATVNEWNPLSNILIVPNPVLNEFLIYLPQSNSQEDFNLKIYSAIGELVLFQETEGPLTKVDAEHFSTGIYWIELLTRERVFRGRFVKH
jgi:hypothetical protein